MNNVPGVTGNKMRLYSGGYIDFANPTVQSIELYDIAVGLGSECRFGNQLSRHYSVAEHCLHCLDLARQMRLGTDIQRAVLMHDAAEAYCLDIPKPLKIMLPEYSVIEKRLQGVIGIRFGLFECKNWVKRIDLMLLKAEKSRFGKQDKQHDLSSIEDIDFECLFLSREEATQKFMRAAVGLGLNQ